MFLGSKPTAFKTSGTCFWSPCAIVCIVLCSTEPHISAARLSSFFLLSSLGQIAFRSLGPKFCCVVGWWYSYSTMYCSKYYYIICTHKKVQLPSTWRKVAVSLTHTVGSTYNVLPVIHFVLIHVPFRANTRTYEVAYYAVFCPPPLRNATDA